LRTPADAAPAHQANVPWRRLAFFVVAAQCLALTLLGYMLLNKHRSLLDELMLSRIEIEASDLETALRTGAMSGLQPGEMFRLEAMVQHLKAADPAIAAIAVLSVEAHTARIVFADDPGQLGKTLPADEWQSTSAHGFTRHDADAGPQIEVAVRDAAGVVIGGLRVRAAGAPLAAASQAMANSLWYTIAAAVGALTVLTLAALARLRAAGSGAALHRRIVVLALSSTLAASAFVAWQADRLFGEQLKPAVTAKVQGIADLLANKLEYAAALEIPLDKLPGVTDYFAGIIARHPEVAALRLSDATGGVLAEHGAARGRWITRAVGNAQVAAATDERFVARRLGELAADVGIVLLVSGLIFRELLAALLHRLPRSGGVPTLSALQSLRLPLFLFILSEEMSRSFLPLYLQSFTSGSSFLGQEAEVGLPITAYMLCFALATPFAGRWTDRWGIARVFAAGVGLALAGFAWTALATAYWQLLPARALCACGYAACTIACQRQLIALTGPAERARGLALFVGAVGIAAICGSALGGVLAEQFGFRLVFALSALLTLLALAAFHSARVPTMAPGDAGPLLGLAEVRRLFADRRFTFLMLGGAVPAKIALAGYLFYLTPLALHQLAYSPAAIGRAVMLYFVLVAAVNPLASWLADHFGWRLALTVGGGLLIGLGGLAGVAGWLPAEAAVWTGIAALGIGTGLAAAPMQALASEIGARAGATSVAVVLRTVERLGSVIGPLWAGAWLVSGDWRGAMAAIGVAVLAGTLLCLGVREEGAR
jgi:MFS family permease